MTTSNLEHRRALFGTILVATSAIVWSSAGMIVRSLDSADAWTTIFWRSVSASLFLIVFMAARHGRLIPQFRRMGFPGLLVGGFLALASISFVIALRLTTVANTLMIMSASPLFAAVMGRIFLGEAIRPLTYLTIVSVMGGFALMMSNSSSSWSLAGDFFALLIAVGYAASIVLVRRYHQIGMAPAACWGAIIAVLASLPFASPLSVTGHDFPILMLFGVGQLGGGLALFVTGVSMIPAANSALLGMIETVLGTLWVWLFFGEAPTPLVLAGGVLVLASIAINTVYGLRRRPASTMELGPVA